MTPVRMYRTILIAITGLLTAASLTVRADAQSNMSSGVKNVVFVHGAWADGSSWSKVIPLLEAKGLHVVAVQNPLTSLADDVAATKRAIALEDGPVILVGHSYLKSTLLLAQRPHRTHRSSANSRGERRTDRDQ
jgi:pimeloyl-ACP methyl ester carboxylesterase